jgi:hypothetical protein
MSNGLYAAVSAGLALPASAALHWPAIYLSGVTFLVVLILQPARLLRPKFRRRMYFWSFYEYGLAKAELDRLRLSRSKQPGLRRDRASVEDGYER